MGLLAESISTCRFQQKKLAVVQCVKEIMSSMFTMYKWTRLLGHAEENWREIIEMPSCCVLQAGGTLNKQSLEKMGCGSCSKYVGRIRIRVAEKGYISTKIVQQAHKGLLL